MGLQTLLPGEAGDFAAVTLQRLGGVVGELDFFTKSSTDSGLMNRAVPLVGRVWLGPAK